MTAALLSSLALGTSAFAATPAGLTPPAGATLVAQYNATGVQVYTCQQQQGKLQWTFNSPYAELFDVAGQPSIQHRAGPSWQGADGSKIVGKMLQQAPSETLASIPQLLLATVSVSNPGTLSAIRYVQRLHTVGGLAPAGACNKVGEKGMSPYLAQYVFYK